jgi:hypothetical protein
MRLQSASAWKRRLGRCGMDFFAGGWGLVRRENVPQGLKLRSLARLMSAALEVLRHPKADLRG